MALRPSTTRLRTCSACPPPTSALFRHVKYKTEVTRGLDILPILLFPAHTRHHHQQQHMEAPNNGAANTLLKRPRLAQCSAHAVWCSNTPVPCTMVFDSRSISPCVLYQSGTTGTILVMSQSILPSWSLASSRSAGSLHHYTSSCYSSHCDMHCRTSSALSLTLLCRIAYLTIRDGRHAKHRQNGRGVLYTPWGVFILYNATSPF
jgi:hypothetical protein